MRSVSVSVRSSAIPAWGLRGAAGRAVFVVPGSPGSGLETASAGGKPLAAAVSKVITEAGLVTKTPPVYEQVPVQIADGPTTTLVVTFDGITATHAAYALSMGQTPETGARKALADVVAQLTDLARLVGVEHLGPETSFAPTLFAIQASGSEADPSSPPVDWPLATVSLSAAARCLVVDDPAAPEVFSSMTTATRARQAGVIYSIAVRPVLPAEAGCGTGG